MEADSIPVRAGDVEYSPKPQNIWEKASNASQGGNNHYNDMAVSRPVMPARETPYVMLSVYPETRDRVRKRKGNRSYDNYLRHLLEIEDDHIES